MYICTFCKLPPCLGGPTGTSACSLKFMTVQTVRVNCTCEGHRRKQTPHEALTELQASIVHSGVYQYFKPKINLTSRSDFRWHKSEQTNLWELLWLTSASPAGAASSHCVTKLSAPSISHGRANVTLWCDRRQKLSHYQKVADTMSSLPTQC